MQKREAFDLKTFTDVVEMLVNNIPLPEKYHNHILEPKNKGLYECHLKPDWLLVYMIDKDLLILTLTRTGSHSDLF